MVYIRRYLSGQQATTVTIAEGAITSDKIVDGAVTHPKLASGSVDSERVIDSSLKSEDIKDGEIKSQDIASGAVTTDKIASQAVTVDKLEASIQGIARPLTPGVATAEIADLAVTEGKLADNSVGSAKVKDGNVSAAKLAANSVETVKIKDGSVSTAKIAGGAVDQTKIGVGAVTGSEILNESVGVTELATDSVQTIKVKDRNITGVKVAFDGIITENIANSAVTSPKLDLAALSRAHIENKETRVLSFYEEFCGLFVSDRWQRTATGGYFIGPCGEKGVHLLTDALNGAIHRMNWGNGEFCKPDVLKPVMNTWIQDRHATLTYQTNIIGLVEDTNNWIVFIAEDLAGATPNWKASCKILGAETLVDTGVPITVDPQILSIDILSGALVKFSIDGIEEAEITTNIPVQHILGPWLEVVARSNAARWLKVRYVSLLANRPDYA